MTYMENCIKFGGKSVLSSVAGKAGEGRDVRKNWASAGEISGPSNLRVFPKWTKS